MPNKIATDGLTQARRTVVQGSQQGLELVCKRGCAGHHRTQGKAADSSNYQKWPRVALDLTIKPDSKQKYRNAH